MTAAAAEEPPRRPSAWAPQPDADLALAADVLAPWRNRPTGTRSRLRSGRWRSYEGVVVMHNGPLTAEQSMWVGLFRAGEGAVLAAASAMREAGVAVSEPPRPQIVIPWWRTGIATPLADVRRSRLMTALDVHPARQPPQFRLARATIDAASLSRRPDDVRALLCAPVQQRRLQVQQLRETVLRLGPVSGRGLMLRTLDDLQLGAQSTHELRFTRALRRAQLPQPDRQVWKQRPGGRRYLDCEWDEYDVHVEIDGLAHRGVAEWVADLSRTNELEIIAPRRRLRIVGFLLFEQEDVAVDQVRRALRAGGCPC